MSKRILSISSFILGLLLVVGISQSNAQSSDQIKIGYVDPQEILSKMPEMKAVQQRLQNFADKKRQELQQKQKNFNDQVTSFQQKSSVLSGDAKKKEQQRLSKLNSDLQQAQQQARQELQKKQKQLVGPLLDQINDNIDAVAKQMGLTYVLNTRTSSGDVIILYASDSAQAKYDITSKVEDKMGM